jgi:hypothetical protein
MTETLQANASLAFPLAVPRSSNKVFGFKEDQAIRQATQTFGYSGHVASEPRTMVPWTIRLRVIRNRCPPPISKNSILNSGGLLEHGIQENNAAPGTPLLVIPGAESSKRPTLWRTGWPT